MGGIYWYFRNRIHRLTVLRFELWHVGRRKILVRGTAESESNFRRDILWVYPSMQHAQWMFLSRQWLPDMDRNPSFLSLEACALVPLFHLLSSHLSGFGRHVSHHLPPWYCSYILLNYSFGFSLFLASCSRSHHRELLFNLKIESLKRGKIPWQTANLKDTNCDWETPRNVTPSTTSRLAREVREW